MISAAAPAGPARWSVDLETSRRRVRAFLDRMTLAEKAGQMTQADRSAITPDQVARFGIGSVLSGGGSNPTPNTPSDWAAMVGAYLEAGSRSRLGIPILYGVDAVHGHSNVAGATIFPHNVGLGASGDGGLVERVYRATAVEAAATGVRWDFAPTVAVSIDPRWGRSYESFGDDPELVARLGAAAVRGLHGDRVDAPDSVLACLKHYVGDGAAEWGTASRAEWTDWWNGWGTQWHIDQGDARLDEATLRSVHLRPYVDGVEAGALSVMVSYSSWNGAKLHGHRTLITDVLKGELGFEGFVVSDWMGIDQLDPDPHRCVVSALNAGIDMVMVPLAFERFVAHAVAAVESGDVPLERVDDAVLRILTVKDALGLFEPPQPEAVSVDEVGSPDHRMLAREAAAASAVLLQHREGTLPIAADRLLVAGDGADDIGLQCGGWTVEWQGGSGPITAGTTILEGLREVLPGSDIRHDPAAGFAPGEVAPVGIAVIAERPYAEGLGDRGDLRVPEADLAMVERLRARVDRLVLVVVSGRPLVLGDLVDRCDAIVAAWLPGTEGAGVADVLTGRRPFTGSLPRRWPAGSAQVDDPAGDWSPQWDRGHGCEAPLLSDEQGSTIGDPLPSPILDREDPP
jgi:beta-glucosidase